MGDIDEKVVRNRRDPRAEPSVPPERRVSEQPAIDITELAPKTSAPPAAESLPEAEALVQESIRPKHEPAPVSTREKEPSSRAVVTAVDPRLVELDPVVRAADWDAVIKMLGNEPGKLPPNLGLLYAVARKEKETLDDKGTASTELAMRCTAGLLGVAPDSAIALVVAKRLIRKNPVAFRERPAPPASVTAIIIVIALIVGSAVGWLFAAGHVSVRFKF